MILNSFVTVYQVNIGRLAVTDSEAAAASASNARLEEIIYLDAYTAEAPPTRFTGSMRTAQEHL